jgi:hypothetical protein
MEQVVDISNIGYLKQTHLKRMSRLSSPHKHVENIIKPDIWEKRKNKVFLSHSWTTDNDGRDNHKRICQLNKLLNDAGVETWFDETCLSGHIVQSMCQGIDESDIVIVCICREYINKCVNNENNNCKLELDYSYDRKGGCNLIPIIMEPDCQNTKSWNGPVGAYLGQHLYISFIEDDFHNVDKLIDEIDRIILLRNNNSKNKNVF